MYTSYKIPIKRQIITADKQNVITLHIKCILNIKAHVNGKLNDGENYLVSCKFMKPSIPYQH